MLGKWNWNEVDFVEGPLFAGSKAMHGPPRQNKLLPFPTSPHIVNTARVDTILPLSQYFYLWVADKDLPVLAKTGRVWVEPTTTMGPLYTVKKVQEFPVSSRDVTNQTTPGQE